MYSFRTYFITVFILVQQQKFLLFPPLRYALIIIIIYFSQIIYLIVIIIYASFFALKRELIFFRSATYTLVLFKERSAYYNTKCTSKSPNNKLVIYELFTQNLLSVSVYKLNICLCSITISKCKQLNRRFISIFHCIFGISDGL